MERVSTQYTTDYDTAVNRQQSLRRKREIENATKPFLAWVEGISRSDIFDHYDSVVEQMWDRMPWIAESLPQASLLDERITKARIPQSLFRDETDPRRDFIAVASELTNFAVRLVTDADLKTVSLHNIRVRFEGLLRRLQQILDKLKEAEDFFQPAVLGYICNLANEHDNPKKRKYEAGLMSISCKRDKGNASTVQIPRKFKLPDRGPLERFREALLGISERKDA
jgi:hypothetical protein